MIPPCRGTGACAGAIQSRIHAAWAEGIPAGYDEALDWFKRAAEQGDARAQHFVGHFYYYGYGAEKNLREARDWFRLAAENGNEDARARLKFVEPLVSLAGTVYSSTAVLNWLMHELGIEPHIPVFDGL